MLQRKPNRKPWGVAATVTLALSPVLPVGARSSADCAKLDGARFREAAERIAAAELAKTTAPGADKMLGSLFLAKGRMTLENLLSQSVIGPIGVPAADVLYLPIVTADVEPMYAMHDDVIRMSAEELPPAQAF